MENFLFSLNYPVYHVFSLFFYNRSFSYSLGPNSHADTTAAFLYRVDKLRRHFKITLLILLI